jgi:predicted metal-dependent phosphoesterase TrpH
MDCNMPLEQVISRCLKKNINCLAIADHGTITGALKLTEIAPFQIIVAEEILTPHGEIMGFFLREEIPSGLSAEETVARIKAQDGLVCIPHPYDSFRLSAFNTDALEAIMPSIDIIEIYNARSLTPGSKIKAQQLAQKYNKLGSAGSDAHTPQEIGNAYIEIPEFNGKDEFLNSLARGKIVGHPANPFVHFISTRNKLKKRSSKGELPC